MKRLVACALGLLALPGCGLLRASPPEYPYEERADGLVVHDLLVPEDGPAVALGDRLTIAYSIELAAEGTVVDSTAERGSPFELELVPGAVFAGLERGLLGMRLRGSREIFVPAALGYGERGLPPRIPPGADLRVLVELIELERAAEPGT